MKSHQSFVRASAVCGGAGTIIFLGAVLLYPLLIPYAGTTQEFLALMGGDKYGPLNLTTRFVFADAT